MVAEAGSAGHCGSASTVTSLSVAPCAAPPKSASELLAAPTVGLGSSAKAASWRAEGVVPSGVKAAIHCPCSMSKKRTSLSAKPEASAPPKTTSEPPKTEYCMPARGEGWFSRRAAMTWTSPSWRMFESASATFGWKAVT